MARWADITTTAVYLVVGNAHDPDLDDTDPSDWMAGRLTSGALQPGVNTATRGGSDQLGVSVSKVWPLTAGDTVEWNVESNRGIVYSFDLVWLAPWDGSGG